MWKQTGASEWAGEALSAPNCEHRCSGVIRFDATINGFIWRAIYDGTIVGFGEAVSRDIARLAVLQAHENSISLREDMT